MKQWARNFMSWKIPNRPRYFHDNIAVSVLVQYRGIGSVSVYRTSLVAIAAHIATLETTLGQTRPEPQMFKFG